MARSLRPPLTGIGRYTLNLATRMAPMLHPDRLTLFLTREVRGLNGLDCDRIVSPVPTPHEVFRAAWEHTAVPYETFRHKIDVYHSPNYTLPLALPCPGVVTIHDLAFMDPRFHNTRLRLYLKLLTGVSIRRAAHVVAVSRYTKGEIERRFPHAAGKVSVVYSGLDPVFENQNGAPSVSNGGRPYVLFVGSIEPRKNLKRLIRAFELAMDQTGLPHELVLCGPWGWRYQPVVEALAGSPMRDRIRHLGYVPSSELPRLYAGADALTYPSLDEGFGFPIIEAMSTGTPVITSDRAAPPEVAGGAALTVTPENVEAIAAAIGSVLTDPALADDLAQRGRARAAEFSWARAAEQTIDILRSVAR